jgi:lipid A 3-O-deacylase
MFRVLIHYLVALTAIFGSVRLAPAAVPELPAREVQIFIENDMLAGTDRYYTNGIKLGIGASGSLVAQLLKLPADGLLRQIISLDASTPHFGLFLGQNLYTPRDIGIAAPQPGDRPWAAWLYLGGIAQVVRGETLHTVEFDIGVTGPAALGDPIQTGWHRLVGVGEPRGWHNQGPTEPAFMLSYLQKRKYGSAHGVELVPHAGVTIGTVLTLARAGALLRMGHNMTGFGQDTIEPGGAMLQGTRMQRPCASWRPCEWFGYVGADYRLVGYNTFLDGPVFRRGPSVDRRVHVHDLTAGVTIRAGTLRLGLTRVWRSEEFTTATSRGGRQSFYSLNVGMDF